MRCVLLAVAALGVALTLQGCGTPQFVLDECESALTYALAKSTVDGVVDAQNACTSTFQAPTQKQLCANQATTTIQKAEAHLMKPYITECGEFVIAQACPSKSDCDGKPDKVKPTAAIAAVGSFVSAHSAAILVDLARRLSASIKVVTQQEYNNKFNSRVVPATVKNQCTLLTGQQVDDVRLTQPPISALSIRCNDQEKAAQKGGLWYTACVSAGTEAIIAALKMWKKQFISQCAAGTLNAVCPAGSACAIETSTADVQALTTQAAAWVTNSYNPMTAQVAVTLGNMATSWMFNGPAFTRLFEVHGIEVTASHLAIPGAFFAACAAIAGLGALIVARRRMQTQQAGMQGRPILSEDAEEALAAELE